MENTKRNFTNAAISWPAYHMLSKLAKKNRRNLKQQVELLIEEECNRNGITVQAEIMEGK